MALFYGGRGLGILGPLYQPERGIRSVDHMDFASPIQLVHDVGRSVELGAVPSNNAGTNGFIRTIHPLEMAADATNVLESFTIESVIRLAITGSLTGTANFQDYRAWLMQVSARVNDNITTPYLSVTAVEATGNTTGAAATEMLELLALFNVKTTQPVQVGPPAYAALVNTGNIAGQITRLPRRMQTGSGAVHMVGRCAGGGAATRLMIAQFLWWIGLAEVMAPSQS